MAFAIQLLLWFDGVHSSQTITLTLYWASCLKSSVWMITLQSTDWMKTSEIKNVLFFLSVNYVLPFSSLSQCFKAHWASLLFADTPLRDTLMQLRSLHKLDDLICKCGHFFTVLCFIVTSHLERDSVLTGSPHTQQPGSHSRRFRKGQERSRGPFPCRLVQR